MAKSWLTSHSTCIAAVKDLVTILLAPIALISLFVAIWQLHSTSNSIKSNTVYQITHEGREIARELAKAHPPSSNTGLIFNFIHSVWHQHRLGSIDEEIWHPFTEEVCQLLKERDITDYWNETNKKLFAPEFVEFIDGKRRQCAG